MPGVDIVQAELLRAGRKQQRFSRTSPRNPAPPMQTDPLLSPSLRWGGHWVWSAATPQSRHFLLGRLCVICSLQLPGILFQSMRGGTLPYGHTTSPKPRYTSSSPSVTPRPLPERERGTVLCDACVAAVIRIAHCVCVVVCFSGHKFIAFIDAVATLLPLSFAANRELDCFADDWRSPPPRLQLVPPEDKQITRPT